LEGCTFTGWYIFLASTAGTFLTALIGFKKRAAFGLRGGIGFLLMDICLRNLFWKAIALTCHGCSKAKFSEKLEDHASRKVIVTSHMGHNYPYMATGISHLALYQRHNQLDDQTDLVGPFHISSRPFV
jgi:hypothetical protein